MSTIFYQIFIFNQMIAIQKLCKMFLIQLKNFFHSQDFQNFVFPSSPLFLPVNQCFRDWSKINLKVYDVINCLNKNLITFCLISRERKNVWHLSIWKNHAQNAHQKLVPDPFLTLVKNPKQPLHARNYFKNKMFWKRITKKP